MKACELIPGPEELNLPCSEHFASLGLQVGVVLCVLALLPVGLLGIGFCNSPKELILHLFGLTSAGLCLLVAHRLAIDWIDLLFCIFLLLSILSGSLATADRWEAIRTVGVTLSGMAIFWSARDLASEHQRWVLLRRASLAVLLVAVGVLIDAFIEGHGVSFSKPGGTQGNRNWAGHLLALGMPLLALPSTRHSSAKRIAIDLLTLLVCSAALVLTRSRAAWIGAVLGTGFPLVLLAASSRRSNASIIRQVAASVCALMLGLLAGVYSPTCLDWKSPHPYVETAQNLLAYDRGSGRGRIVQYRHSLAMVIDHPAFGVGPGNWKILYPAYSIGMRPPVIAPIWQIPSRPNSDWVAFSAERGVPATVVLLAAFVSLAVGQLKSVIGLVRSTDYDERSHCALATIGILIALAVVSSFDAVLQLPAPTFLLFLSLGALAPRAEILASLQLNATRRGFMVLIIVFVASLLIAFIVHQIVVASLIARHNPDALATASRMAVDPRWFLSEWEWSRRGNLGCL